MMIFSTLSIAAILIAVLYFIVIRRLRWPLAAYGIIALTGGGCLFAGSVHFAFIGIEVLGLGSFLVWLHFRFWRKDLVESLNSD